MANAEAEEYKKKGNDAFKERNWDEAIKQYNKAIALDPNNAAYYSNRAGAWSSKGKHESALADANKCLAQDRNFVKGYARKGKALFDMSKWDEAEEAYKDGIAVDVANDSCMRGLADISAARQRKRQSGGGGGGAGGMMSGLMGGGLATKLLEGMKSGGRMKMYMMMMGGYMLFTMIKGSTSSGSSSSRSSTLLHEASDGIDTEPQASPGQVRHFADIGGSWLSYLQVKGKADSALLLLHRTSLSAEAEFGSLLPRLRQVASGPRLLIPDRPCHGYSTCPSGGEPDAAVWLNGFLTQRGAAVPPRLAVVAAGREAMGYALALARRRPEVTQVWLLAPRAEGPAPVSFTSAQELTEWLAAQRGAKTVQELADAARWAAGGASDREPKAAPSSFNVPKLPDDCKVTILYGEDDPEDEELSSKLELQGVKFKVRNLGTREELFDALSEDVQQLMAPEDHLDEEET
mmetsp:Transcript_35882/g.78576  ORF Transcript_35882/g.78576 Transcript_35882/m.78576 type:complete len:462 (+) Transcript_35882:85-1470(+)